MRSDVNHVVDFRQTHWLRGKNPAKHCQDHPRRPPGADSGDEEKSKRTEKLGTKEKLPLGLRGCVKMKAEMAGFFVGGSVVVLLPL